MGDKRNVLLIVVDCLRADYAYGWRGGAVRTSLRSLAQKGTCFTQAVSTTSVTSPNVADILTGVYPFQHGIRGLYGYKLNPDVPTLAQILGNHGYHTQAMVSGPLLSGLGLDRGFDHYDYRETNRDFGFGLEEKFVEVLRRLEEPWLLLIHAWGLHAPRRLPEAFNRKEFGRNRYEKALSAFDYFFSDILKRVDLEDTILILTGDHGENLKTAFLPDLFRRMVGKIHEPKGAPLVRQLKGRLVRSIRRTRVKYNLKKDGLLTQPGHGFHVYEHLIRVPLITVCRGLIPEGKAVHSLVRHVDILPTILDLNRIHVPDGSRLHGETLLSRMAGGDGKNAEAYLLANGECLLGEDNWLYGIRTSEYKYVYSPHDESYQELYDLLADPLESTSIAEKEPVLSVRFKEKVEKVFSAGVVFDMDEKEKARLEQTLKDLGYL